VDRRWRVSVRIVPSEYLALKSYLLDLAYRRSVEGFSRAFNDVPFERYAPVRRQLLNILLVVNRKRKLAGWDPVPTCLIRLRRRIVRPFGVPIDEGSSNAAA